MKRRGLAQGDRLSLLMFVLVMEYFSKIMKEMSALTDFRFHPLCRSQKLTQPTFADELMYSSKGTEQLAMRIIEAMKWFL